VHASDAAPIGDAQDERLSLPGHVLMNGAGGEAGERAAAGGEEGVGPVAAGGARLGERAVEPRERLVPRLHRTTPTSTFRKRAGATPWPTCADWPGSPLPQFGVPQSRQCFSLQTASQEPQNSGVIPV